MVASTSTTQTMGVSKVFNLVCFSNFPNRIIGCVVDDEDAVWLAVLLSQGL